MLSNSSGNICAVHFALCQLLMSISNLGTGADLFPQVTGDQTDNEGVTRNGVEGDLVKTRGIGKLDNH